MTESRQDRRIFDLLQPARLIASVASVARSAAYLN